MAMKHVILGLIEIYGSQTGYSLQKHMVLPQRPTLPHVYHVLRDMEDEELIERNTNKNEDEFTKHIYRLTQKGKSELNNWLTEQNDMAPMREPVMQKLAFSGSIDVATVLSSLKSFYDFRKSEVTYYENINNKLLTNPQNIGIQGDINVFYYLLTMKFALIWGQAELTAIHNCIEEIEIKAEDLKNRSSKK